MSGPAPDGRRAVPSPERAADDPDLRQDGSVTDPSPAPSDIADQQSSSPPVDRSLPPDPAAYDSPRASIARARGLSAPYIAGGRDPDPASGRGEERRYGRLLLAMVVVIVLSGFVLGILGSVITALRGG
jgi:hypothetical protein